MNIAFILEVTLSHIITNLFREHNICSNNWTLLLLFQISLTISFEMSCVLHCSSDLLSHIFGIYKLEGVF